MKIYELIQKIKTKIFEPKVYSVILGDSKGHSQLWLGLAFCFDEAFHESVKSAIKNFPSPQGVEGVSDWRPVMWTSISLKDLIARATGTEVKTEVKEEEVTEKTSLPKETTKDKNAIMKEIIDNFDVKLFRESEALLTNEEKMFLLEEVKKKGVKVFSNLLKNEEKPSKGNEGKIHKSQG